MVIIDLKFLDFNLILIKFIVWFSFFKLIEILNFMFYNIKLNSDIIK